MKKYHNYAPFILLDSNILTHLGHAIYDLHPNREKLLPDELKNDLMWLTMSRKHSEKYKRGLQTGDRSGIDTESEEKMDEQYHFCSINMLLVHIEWKQIENPDVSHIYRP